MKTLMMQYSTVASRDTAPFNWQAAGMGYIFRSSEGRFIVIDGGREPDTEALVERMEQLSEGKKPQIAYWVITHPHYDHYGALMGLAASEDLRARVQLDIMLFCLPDENIYYEN